MLSKCVFILSYKILQGYIVKVDTYFLNIVENWLLSFKALFTIKESELDYNNIITFTDNRCQGWMDKQLII